MGLDMYLYQNKSVPQSLMEEIKEHTKGEPETIKSLVAQWRKANQIHRYFVEEIGDGEDNQSPIYAELSDIEDLCDKCHRVLAHHATHPNDHSVAKELLPTMEGFFFGDTEYNEYYYEQIEDTIKDLEKLFLNKDGTRITQEQAWKEDITFVYECNW